MKIKHLVSTLLLAAGLAFSAPSIAPEIGISNMMTTVSAAQEGWNQDSNGWYYLQNNVRLLRELEDAAALPPVFRDSNQLPGENAE